MKIKDTRSSIGTAVKYVLLVLGAILLMFPFVWMLLTSVKTLSEAVHIPPQWLPAVPQWNNYVHVGPIISGDCFYTDVPQEGWEKMGVLAGEMEAAALYATAARAGREALCICTISDIIGGPNEQRSTPEERERSFTDMIRLALEIA